jgi:3-oxoacyl-[acyl-carrier protein] reductase
MSASPRVTLITGAANGIGRATALAFAAAGDHVVAWDLDADRGAALVADISAAGGSAEFVAVDVRDRSAVVAAVTGIVEAHGRVDVLINNAGILRDARLIKLDDADFDAVIAVNLKAVFTCTQAVAPFMIAAGRGRIVNASSVVALHGNFGQTNYVAAKSGVIGMTKVWARELGRHGITVNAIAPGFVGTDMVAQMPAEILAGMIGKIPVGRIGAPEDIARAYLFLAADAAGFINGAVLSVDGGMVLGS